MCKFIINVGVDPKNRLPAGAIAKQVVAHIVEQLPDLKKWVTKEFAEKQGQ